MSGLIKLILKWVISAVAIMGTAYLLKGIIVPGPYIAFVLALVFGLLNAVLRPVLIILTLPVTILTLGLFTLVINGFLFWLPTTFIEGFVVENFWWAIGGALLVSIFSWIGNALLSD
tara:strand:+ start:876 stop:1226 length:351 start_codon:yes stop_codon:yes gene_type:complete